VSLQHNVLSQTNFKYDALGRRIGKQNTQGGATSRVDYIYDRNNILFESDAAGVRHATYIGTGETDNHLMMVRDGTTHFYHTDQLGSVIALTNSNGQIEEQVLYSAFGKIQELTTGPTRTPASISAGVANPYYFAGREFDQETGLYFNRARYYDPGTGRFTGLDPIRYGGGDSNFYRYVLNNPLKGIDPMGTTIWDITGDARTSNIQADPYYQSLNSNPNTLVILTSGPTPDQAYGATIGARGLISVTINPDLNGPSSEFYNTVTHELVHAEQINTGNFSYSNSGRRDFRAAEGEATAYGNQHAQGPVCAQ